MTLREAIETIQLAQKDLGPELGGYSVRDLLLDYYEEVSADEIDQVLAALHEQGMIVRSVELNS